MHLFCDQKDLKKRIVHVDLLIYSKTTQYFKIK